eukprot:CAMPEP_0174903244 /NCGR_PEP_ID=MMETSP0167-20121228/42862_1 /TAXON_ID=38298 /ORGANISM="Rhodella maculata, Strain CCMP736" /LENGTH=69 /DNA_ID=CAMNT_0016145521 /DNA_START=46 /DNA_END=252 /DNA_ORIENTATION=+
MTRLTDRTAEMMRATCVDSGLLTSVRRPEHQHRKLELKAIARLKAPGQAKLSAQLPPTAASPASSPPPA